MAFNESFYFPPLGAGKYINWFVGLLVCQCVSQRVRKLCKFCKLWNLTIFFKCWYVVLIENIHMVDSVKHRTEIHARINNVFLDFEVWNVKSPIHPLFIIFGFEDWTSRWWGQSYNGNTIFLFCPFSSISRLT